MLSTQVESITINVVLLKEKTGFIYRWWIILTALIVCWCNKLFIYVFIAIIYSGYAQTVDTGFHWSPVSIFQIVALYMHNAIESNCTNMTHVKNIKFHNSRLHHAI